MLIWTTSAGRASTLIHRLTKPVILIVMIAAWLMILETDSEAAPGGQFVKQALSSKYGKIGAAILGILLLLAVILLLPLIVYVYFKEAAGIKQTKKDLAELARKYPWFDWLSIRSRVDTIVRKISKVWSTGDLSPVASLMTRDYFTSQQEMLQRWSDEGKEIVYRVEKVRKIEPLAVRVEDENAHSWIRVKVVVDCTDYMRDRHTSKIVKGELEKQTGFETVWCMIYLDGEWRLGSIEEGSTSLTWAIEKNQTSTGYLDQTYEKRRQDHRLPAAASEHEQTEVKRAKSKVAPPDSRFNQATTHPEREFVREPTDDQAK